MKLATAINRNAKGLAYTQNSYKQSVVAVNTQMTSVLTSKLPTLNTYPPDWNDYVAAYEQATGDALNWVNNVMARLLNVPQEVQSYNSVISNVLADAAAQANTLVNNPSDQTALQLLENDLKTLSTQLNIVITFISGAVTQISNFKDKLPDMAAQLTAIAQKSAQDANADQAQIDKLKQDIERLQADIKSLTASIIALSIADGVALTMGVVATIALWPVGALTWFVLGPAVAVATTYIALDAMQIKADKAAIDADQTAISGLTADVATLQVLAQNYTDMANGTVAVESDLQAVLQAWQTLEADVQAAITDIQTASSDASSKAFQAVANDVADAIQEWDAAYEQAGSLVLDLQVNNASLEYGMSSSQVGSTLAQGQTVDIITYYNQVSAA